LTAQFDCSVDWWAGCGRYEVAQAQGDAALAVEAASLSALRDTYVANAKQQTVSSSGGGVGGGPPREMPGQQQRDSSSARGGRDRNESEGAGERPSTFLREGEAVVLSGPVLKKGPSVLSPFRPRLLVLTGRRLVYLASVWEFDKTGVIVLSNESVAGVTHGGSRFELSAMQGEKQEGLRRYYFEVGTGFGPQLKRAHSE